MSDLIVHDHHHDGIDRRGFLKCMAWAGTGVLWTVSGGMLSSKVLGQVPAGAGVAAAPGGCPRGREVRVPLFRVQMTPVPAQAMHLRKPRRSLPSRLWL